MQSEEPKKENKTSLDNATNICSRMNDQGSEDVLRRDMFIGHPLSRTNCKATLGAECSSFMFSPPFTNPLQPEQTLISKQEFACRSETAQPQVDLKPM